MRHDESRIQAACVKWFRLQYPHFAPNLFAVPNGGQTKGRQRDTQKAWQKSVESVGYKYILCRSIESFIAQVNDYLR